ncbi:MAG: L-aspartate oxidase [Parvibaculum sp.]|nr:L-aspartate oxidase [Parvibaculum sp.]
MSQRKIVDAGDVLIVGAGLAGLFTALKLAPRAVTVLAAAPIGDGASSAWAQGGVAASVDAGDTPASHTADTVVAGAGIVDEGVMLRIAQEAGDRIEDLLRLGVPFDRDLEGKLSLGREAAHSHRRIVRVRGDRAGRAIMEALVAAVRATPSIRVIEGYSAFELIKINGRIEGVHAHDADGNVLSVSARATVLASGGVGQLFAVTTNPLQAQGQGIAMAARAGAVIADPEFVQFHPTAIAGPRDPAPLVTEALRGEGAILIDGQGRRFMPTVHPDAELAPRDVVARSIYREIAAGRSVFLDTRGVLGARLPEAFPTVYENCISMGIDPVADPIPVAPAAHYHMGGIKVDEQGRTSLDGLWACGEVSSTGAHGANRLASNSLLEAVVYGARIAEDIAQATLNDMSADIPAPLLDPSAPVSPLLVTQLRQMMTANVGVIRNRDAMVEALATLTSLEQTVGMTNLFSNLTTTAKLIAAGALAREESRGGHFRSDFPEPRETWRHRTAMTLDDANRITRDASMTKTQKGSCA